MKPSALALAIALAGCKGYGAPPDTRTSPPPSVAVQEKPAPPPAPKAAAPPGLVGHWTLDDGKAVDAVTGRAGTLKGGPAPTAGKIGGALAFDGKDDHVELPNSKELDGLTEGNYTVAAWFKPADVPSGQESDNSAGYGIIAKTGWHTGLRYTNEKKFTFEHWLATDKADEPRWTGAGAWDQDYEPGQWYHVAGVVSRTTGAVSVYLDGELKGSGEGFDANAKARAYGTMTWKIGACNPGAEKWGWPAKGAIDDVRLYNRALSDAEVAELFKAAK